MNKLTIIGNLTANPELRTTPQGKNVCNFSVAVNRRKKIDGQPEVDYFRVSAWNDLGANCAKYLTKGSKVCVIGAVSVRTYTTQAGEHGASLEVMAHECEFLNTPNRDAQSGFEKVETETPFEALPY